MSTSFIFRPHVQEGDLVVTPDLLIDHVFVADTSGSKLKISKVTNDRLSSNPEIQVLGDDTTPDAAVFLAAAGAGMLIGLASNHRYESQNDPQIFCKPVCRHAWRFDQVSDHWESLQIKAVDCKGGVIQEGLLGDFAPVDAIISRLSSGKSTLQAGTAVICAGLRFRDSNSLIDPYTLTLLNPELNRQLELQYSVCVL